MVSTYICVRRNKPKYHHPHLTIHRGDVLYFHSPGTVFPSQVIGIVSWNISRTFPFKSLHLIIHNHDPIASERRQSVCCGTPPDQRCLRATASVITSTTRNQNAVLQGKLQQFHTFDPVTEYDLPPLLLQIPSPATSPCTSVFSNTFYFTQRLHPILQFLLSLPFLSSPVQTFCLHLEGLVVGEQVTKTAGQWRSPVTVTRAEPSGGGCLIQEEGKEDIAEVGETPLPSSPQRKLVSFFRLLPPSPQVHVELSNRRCMVQRSRGKHNYRLSFPDNLKSINLSQRKDPWAAADRPRCPEEETSVTVSAVRTRGR